MIHNTLSDLSPGALKATAHPPTYPPLLIRCQVERSLARSRHDYCAPHATDRPWTPVNKNTPGDLATPSQHSPRRVLRLAASLGRIVRTLSLEVASSRPTRCLSPPCPSAKLSTTRFRIRRLTSRQHRPPLLRDGCPYLLSRRLSPFL